ncbi:MAG: ABC transporter permease [Candidatus Eremiobacteraeota bacterium]|nr:ABC transporter permease [Candidatus Eremiobacteraeota bacterium]
MLLSTAPFAPMFAAQTRIEFLRLLRIPAFSVTSLALPVMFYAFFGLSGSHTQFMGTTYGSYMLASFGAYAVLTIVLFSFGASVAAERGMGSMRLMRAAPLRPLAYFFGKIVASMAFGAIALGVLVMFAFLTGGARIPVTVFLDLLVRLLPASIPFTILGFAVGYLASVNSAIAVLNLINLPLSFASGLFVPVRLLPHFVQSIAPYLPTYHYGQLAYGAVGAAHESWVTSAIWLCGYGALFLFVALRAYRREERKEFA